MISNIIFDWSGTLADDLTAVVEATNRVFAHHEKPQMTRDQFRREFELPFEGFYARHIPGVTLQELDELYHTHFDPLNERIELLPHALDFLDFCRLTGRKTYILSSIRPSHFEKQAKRLGVYGRFDRLYTGVLDKAAVIRKILEDEQLDPLRTVFIGDMEHDIATAHAGGILGVGVGTGYDLREDLLQAGADFVVKDLRELRRIMEPVDRPQPRRMPVPTVGGLIFDDAGRMLMVHTTKWRGTWGIPGGKMREGETQEQALRREIHEETALELDDIRFIMVHDCVFSEEFHQPAHFLLLNYTARCHPDKSSAASVVLNNEATEFRWVTWDEAWQLPLNQPTQALLQELRQRGDL